MTARAIFILPEGVGSTIEKNARGWLSVPSRSPALLVVVLHGLADGMVDDKADVRLVYSHAECDSCHNDLHVQHHTTTHFKLNVHKLHAQASSGKIVMVHIIPIAALRSKKLKL